MIPTELNYLEPVETAFMHQYVQEVLYPTGTFSNGSNAIVRFNVNRTSQVDPYSIYFKITVQVDKNTLTGKQSRLLNDFGYTSKDTGITGRIQVGNPAVNQLDVGNPGDQQQSTALKPASLPGGPAQVTGTGYSRTTNPTRTMSLTQVDRGIKGILSEFIIWDDMNELERLKNADVLAAMLDDVHYSPNVRTQKAWGAYGGTNSSALQNGNFKNRGSTGTAQGVAYGGSANYTTMVRNQPTFYSGGASTPLFFNPLVSQHMAPETLGNRQQPSGYYSNYEGDGQLGGPDFAGLALLMGNYTTGQTLSPATINLLDITSPYSPYYLPPMSMENQGVGSQTQATIGVTMTTNSNTPESLAYLPFCPQDNHGMYTYSGTNAIQGGTVENLTVQTAASTGAGAVWNTRLSLYQLLNGVSGSPNIDNGKRISEFINGTPNPCHGNFATVGYEPYFTWDIVPNYIYQGKPMRDILEGGTGNVLTNLGTFLGSTGSNYPFATHTFMLPLPSCFMGHNLPFSKYKMIPLGAFKNLMIELRFNPNWLFTSWWDDSQNGRQYTIKNIEMHMETAEFFDDGIANSIESALSNGFKLYTHGWYNCLEYSVSGLTIPQNIQINVGFDSLKLFLFCFIDDAYQKYSCCRKQFRLSQNLTEMRLKIGNTYYPSLPIRGQSGSNAGELNNYEFYLHLMKALGKEPFATECAFNIFNSAIGSRKYYYSSNDVQTYNNTVTGIVNLQSISTFNNSSNTFERPIGHLLDMTGLAQSANFFQPNGTNQLGGAPTQTLYEAAVAKLPTGKTLEDMFAIGAYCGNLQYCYFLENTVVGMAMYGIDLDPLNYSETMYSGVPTVGARPFDLMLKNDPSSNSFTGDSTLYGYGLYDMTISLRRGVPAESSGKS